MIKEDSIDQETLNRLISGAIRDCINIHGAITKNVISSASKRITGQLRGYLINIGKEELKNVIMSEALSSFQKDYQLLLEENIKLRKVANDLVEKLELKKGKL